MNSFSFTISYEGKVENESIDYNYYSEAQNAIQIGNDNGTNPHCFSLRVSAITVKRKPFDPTYIYYYALYEFQYSPEGTNIQQNYVRGTSLSDFAEYLGTNK